MNKELKKKFFETVSVIRGDRTVTLAKIEVRPTLKGTENGHGTRRDTREASPA